MNRRKQSWLALILVVGLLAFSLHAEDKPAADDELHAARVKAKQTEVEALKAKIELEQLKLEKLQTRLTAAEEALEKLGGTADEGFIRNWLVLGPIAVDGKVTNHDEASCKELLDRLYTPADGKPKDGDKDTIDGMEFIWKAVDAEDYFVDLSKFAEDNGKDATNSALLGVVYVTSEEEQSGIKLAIGSDDDSVWRLNGDEVVRAYASRNIGKDENTAENLTLKKGVNVLKFTVLNGGNPAAAAARFLDKDGKPAKGLTVSRTP